MTLQSFLSLSLRGRRVRVVALADALRLRPMPAGMPGMFICELISHSSPVSCADGSERQRQDHGGKETHSHFELSLF